MHSPDTIPAAWERKTTTPIPHAHRLEELVITELLQDEPLSRNDLALRTGHMPDQVRFCLKKLQDAGRIRHVGASHGGHWEIA